MFKSVFTRRFNSIVVPSIATGISLYYRNTTEATPNPPQTSSLPQTPVEDSNMVILSGTANRELSKQIADLLHTKLLDVTTRRFSDGELNCVINESIRGKDIIVVQTCAAPVNDNIMELLLTVAAARRAGANTVTAVIPYFGYKYHRRGLPISTTYSSRFLWSAAADLAKMLSTVGVDSVISVDLQRPGQGHEACFFDSNVPVETISTIQAFAEYFKTNIDPPLKKVVVVSANTECVKKARKFQRKLKETTGLDDIEYAVFMRDDSYWAQMGVGGKPSTAPNQSQLLGEVRGADVIIIDDIVDSAGQLSMLCRQLHREGAGRIFICASHGLFTGNSTELIDLSPVERVVVTDSIPLPVGCSKKIAQVSIAPLLANIIEQERVISDYASKGIEPRRRNTQEEEVEDVYVMDDAE